MSTKIFHGYRLAEGTDIWEFTERLRREGNKLRDKLDLDAIETLAERTAATRLDEGKEPASSREAYLMGGYHAWAEVMRQIKESRLGDPHQLDVSFIRDPKTGRIMALLYAGSEMEHVFERQPEVEEYGYWNNSDQPENVTDEEWQEREEAWERCLPGWSPPARQALNFTLRCDATDGIIEMIYREKSDG